MTRPTKEELKEFYADYPTDSDFSAFARLLQSKWRHEKKYEPLTMGNFLPVDFAKEKKVNFLTPKIRELVDTVIAQSKKEGSLIGEPRIWNNLLSSQPLCFNLFGELSLSPDKATKYFQALFQERVSRVERILFEYSPGRKNVEYTGDSSAFDVFVEYYNEQNKLCFIGIEVKYAETLKEETKKKAADNFKNHEKEYRRLTTDKYFTPNAISILQQVPLAQIWRDHMLAISMLEHTDNKYSEGFFVFLFPSQNTQCQSGVNNYKSFLADNDNKSIAGFYPMHLEIFIDTLINTMNDDWTTELKKRYLGT